MILTLQADQIAWFHAGDARCQFQPPQPLRAYHLVLLGPPGVGKGTQAELLCHRLGSCHLSTGDVFRAAQSLEESRRSPALRAAQEAMRHGELVSDATVIAIVRERSACLHCPGGFLLDGFPRTVPQARALDDMLAEQEIALDGVISYELDLEEIVARLRGRRTCSACKAVYHLAARPPVVEGVCEQCGGALFQREDDQPESIRVRMQAYEENTRPLTDYYRAAGKLISVTAIGTPQEIVARTLQANCFALDLFITEQAKKMPLIAQESAIGRRI
jgi:adenylate kinase